MSGRQSGLVTVVAVLAVLALAAPAAIGPAAASSPPESVCPVCGPNLDRAAHEANVALSGGDEPPDTLTRDSTVQMSVSRSGDATFTARVELNRSAARSLRENRSAFDALVDAAFSEARYVLAVDRAEAVDAEMRDDELVVDWTIPDAARNGPGGTVLVTLFGETQSGLDLHADQLVLTGPEGWNVTNHPRSGEVEPFRPSDGDGTGELVLWQGSAHHESQRHLTRSTYVAFGASDGVVARANAELAVALTIGPTMLADAVAAGWLAALVLAVALAGCLFGLGGSPNPRRASRWLAIASGGVVVVGGVYVLLDGYGPLPSRNFQLLALPAGIAAFGMLSTRAPAVANLREAAWRVSGTVGVGGVVAWAVSTSFARVFVAIVTVAIAGFYLVGVYDQRVGWPVAAVSAAILATPILGILPWTPIGGFGPGFAAVFLTAVSVPTAVIGVVVYRIGAGKRVAGDRVVDRRTATG